MQTITTIGLDIAKSIFQVHGVDAAGNVIVRRKMKRRYVLAFSKSCSPAWLVSKHAPPRIIGRVSCRPLGIPCALCRQLT
jgi:transposase